MFNILVVDSSKIDRMMMQDILEKKFASSVSVFSAAEGSDALDIVKNVSVDLIFLNIPYHSVYPDFAEILIHQARNANGSVAVVLVSVKKEEQISRMSTHFSADGYILKPYRREAVISAAEEIMERTKASNAEECEEEEPKDSTLSSYLELLKESVGKCNYKQAKNIVKEYLSLIYADSSVKNIKKDVVDFAEGIAEIGAEYDDGELLGKLMECISKIIENNNLRLHRFESSEVVKEMIDFIFVERGESRTDEGNEIKKVLNYIEHNIKDGITLDSAAEYVNMSPSYFSKIFKKTMGVNFIVYVTDRRIEMAKEMLQNTDMSVINIAAELSYNETNYFSKVFKKKVGVSPTEYRQRFSGVQAE
ncbi:MAG: response regulator transcription factor [Synergistes sp.]|nr:response regulator transcription factor [Synergistes sp.]